MTLTPVLIGLSISHSHPSSSSSMQQLITCYPFSVSRKHLRPPTSSLCTRTSASCLPIMPTTNFITHRDGSASSPPSSWLFSPGTLSQTRLLLLNRLRPLQPTMGGIPLIKAICSNNINSSSNCNSSSSRHLPMLCRTLLHTPILCPATPISRPSLA